MSLRRLDIICAPGEEQAQVASLLLDHLDDSHQRLVDCTLAKFGKLSVTLHPAQVGPILGKLSKLAAQPSSITLVPVQASNPPPPTWVRADGIDAAAVASDKQGKEGRSHHHHRLALRRHHHHHFYASANRKSVEEIHNEIGAGNSIDFDFVISLIGASLIAGVGLATNSATMVVSSMLVSPLMGPILAVTFGAATRDCKMLLRGLVNNAIGCAITLVLGFVMGLIFAPVFAPRYGWPTVEMSSRGDALNLAIGIVFAIASGLVVGVAVTGGGVNALVGTAISASLLPPVANAGMLVAYAAVGPYTVPLLDKSVTDTTDSALATTGSRVALIQMAALSFALFLMNFAIIVATTFVMFELKHVVPASLKPAGDLFTSAKSARAAVKRVMEAKKESSGRYAPLATFGGGGDVTNSRGSSASRYTDLDMNSVQLLQGDSLAGGGLEGAHMAALGTGGDGGIRGRAGVTGGDLL